MVHDTSHGIHDKSKERVEAKKGSDGQVEQRAAPDVVRQPVVTHHEQGRGGKHRVNLVKKKKVLHTRGGGEGVRG